MSSTFERYGGFGTVSKIVMTFYEKVLDSEIAGHHFDDIDMPRLIDHQTKFISSLMGGPVSISDDRLRAVHHHLDVNGPEFDEIAHLLGEALREHGVEARDVTELLNAIEAKRAMIIRPAGASA